MLIKPKQHVVVFWEKETIVGEDKLPTFHGLWLRDPHNNEVACGIVNMDPGLQHRQNKVELAPGGGSPKKESKSARTRGLTKKKKKGACSGACFHKERKIKREG